MRMNRTDHGIARLVLLTRRGCDSRRPSVLGQDARHVDIREHFPAEVLDAGNERISQLPAAADRHTDAISFHESDEHEDPKTR